MQRWAPSPSGAGAVMWWASALGRSRASRRRSSRRAPWRARAPRASGCPRPRRSRSRRDRCRTAATPAAARRCASTAPASLLNPPTPSGVTVASAPPQIIASASPRSMTRAGVADRVRAGRAGRHLRHVRPLGPEPDRELSGRQVDDDHRHEERRDAVPRPLLQRVLQVASMVLTPPRPAPTKQPTRSANSPSISSPESSIASDAAATA